MTVRTADPIKTKPWALGALPPFPAVALRLLEALADEDISIRQVVELVNSDPAFAAELLRVANSPLYGFSHQVLSVQHATVTLGLEFVKALSMTVAMRAYLKTAMRLPTLRRCWRHSLVCAILAEEVASGCRRRGDAAYTAGLLHDVGRIGLLASWPAEYSNLLGVSAEHSFDVLDCERELFDTDHCEAGSWMAREWKLPEHLAEVALRHHEPLPDQPFDDLQIVRFACRLADSLEFGVVNVRDGETYAELVALLPETARKTLDISPEEMRRGLAARIEALA